MKPDELDHELRAAARRAGPVFASEGWQYGRHDGYFSPDAVDLYATIGYLVRTVMAKDSDELNEIGTGRFVVRRREDEIDVLLEIGSFLIDPEDEQ